MRCDCSLCLKPRSKRAVRAFVQRVLTGVPEGGVAGVVPEPDRLYEVLVEA